MNELTEYYILLDHADGILLMISFVIRFLLPLLAFLVIFRCAKSLFADLPEGETWGWLEDGEGTRYPLSHFENTVGRAGSADVTIPDPLAAPTHAVLIRSGKGVWRLRPLRAKNAVFLNGEQIRGPVELMPGDEVTFAATDLVFRPLSEEEERDQALNRRKPGGVWRAWLTLLLLTEFQLLTAAAHWIAAAEKLDPAIPLAFGALIAGEWFYYFFMRILRRRGFEIEILVFFLTTVGTSVIATSVPGDLYKSTLFFVAGLAAFLILGWFLRDLERIRHLRIPLAVGGLLMLAVNLLIAGSTNGARNWISVAGFTLQPSEFVKVCFVFAGAATLDKLFARKNLYWFVAFSAACVVALALMSDFGTAAVFFVAYLVIAFLRSGDVATVILSLSGAGLAGVLAVAAKPYIAGRFSTWLHAWDYASSGGYQQTRTMMAAANGGLFGLGAGSGSLYKVFAADTDMVFGMVCEELGLLVALSAVAAFAIMAAFVIRSARTARSSFYVIGASGALAVLLFQIALNVLGAFDILPFTGVTFPFLSKGGSSLLSCWCLMAFIKAADTRQNASFTVKLPASYRRAVRTRELEDYIDEQMKKGGSTHA